MRLSDTSIYIERFHKTERHKHTHTQREREMLTPVLSFLTSVFFVSIALHHSRRLWALPLISIPAWTSLTTAHEFDDLADLWAMGLVVYFMHNISVLYLEQWVLPRPYNFTAAYKIWSKHQLLNTSRECRAHLHLGVPRVVCVLLHFAWPGLSCTWACCCARPSTCSRGHFYR